MYSSIVSDSALVLFLRAEAILARFAVDATLAAVGAFFAQATAQACGDYPQHLLTKFTARR